MKTDAYTKVVLTLIAIGLFANVGVSLVSEARAIGTGAEVIVTNLATDMRLAGETLRVYCANCR